MVHGGFNGLCENERHLPRDCLVLSVYAVQVWLKLHSVDPESPAFSVPRLSRRARHPSRMWSRALAGGKGETKTNDIACFRRLDDTIVPEPRGRIQRRGLCFNLRLERRMLRGVPETTHGMSERLLCN